MRRCISYHSADTGAQSATSRSRLLWQGLWERCHCFCDALQVEAHHYCSHLNEEVRQCIIYDSANNNARLIGIEYIISRRLFESLPEEEKKLWHSHQYEVRFSCHEALTVQVAVLSAEPASSPDKIRCLRSQLGLAMALYLGHFRSEAESLPLQVMSGMLYAPGVPDSAEIVEMRKLVDTYGKTWHTWQVDRGDTLPLGESAGWPTTLPSDSCSKTRLQMWRIELLPVSTQSGILCQWPV